MLILHIFSLFVLVLCLFLLLQRNLFRILTGFFFLLMNIAVLFLYLRWDFFFAVQIIIYTGGILILLLWIYTTYREIHLKRSLWKNVGVFLAVLGFMLFLLQKIFTKTSLELPRNSSELSELGKLLSEEYGYFFEGISFLLFVALVGSVYFMKQANEK